MRRLRSGLVAGKWIVGVAAGESHYGTLDLGYGAVDVAGRRTQVAPRSDQYGDAHPLGHSIDDDGNLLGGGRADFATAARWVASMGYR